MANNDNAMARFLFAILQQKCLKDIDWNKVAHNPILAQEITNGHAARMRYSRFRAAMLGLEPQRRNRTNPSSKSRISKKKKEDASPKSKKESDEKASGSGIGNIKSENTASAASAPTIKPEPKCTNHLSRPPSQPDAPMATPAMMKTEPGLINPYSQHLRCPSILSASSPKIKQERPLTAATAASTTPSMPEPSPFGMILSTTPTSATSSSSTTPYPDGHHRMHMRLLTPCSDTDGLSQTAFFAHSPTATGDLLNHSQTQHQPLHQHQHQHQQQQHHQHLMAHGSPPLSTTSTASPFDFSTQCCDASGSSPSPWHSQPPDHHHHNHHHRRETPAPAHHAVATFHPHSYSPAYGIGLGVGLGGPAAGYAQDTGFPPFCGGHPCHDGEDGQHLHSLHLHHHHQHQQQLQHHSTEHGGGMVVDPVGLHYHHGPAAATAAAAGVSDAGTAAATATTVFREREIEMEMMMDSQGSPPGLGGFVSGAGQSQGGQA